MITKNQFTAFLLLLVFGFAIWTNIDTGSLQQDTVSYCMLFLLGVYSLRIMVPRYFSLLTFSLLSWLIVGIIIFITYSSVTSGAVTSSVGTAMISSAMGVTVVHLVMFAVALVANKQ